MGELRGGLITALRTLTVLRVPGRDAASLASALPWFPLAGLLVGGVLWGTFTGLLYLLHWSTGAAALTVLLSALLTGGLHLDGLADTVDGWRGGRTRERRLEIMKDSRIGAMGALALSFVLLLQVVALAHFADATSHALRLLPLPFILSRLAMTMLAVSLPYARVEGGTAELFVKDAHARHFFGAMVLALVACVFCAGVMGLCAVLPALLLAWAMRLWMRKNFGGVTGDLLGCACVTVETVLLLLLGGMASRVPSAFFSIWVLFDGK